MLFTFINDPGHLKGCCVEAEDLITMCGIDNVHDMNHK